MNRPAIIALTTLLLTTGALAGSKVPRPLTFENVTSFFSDTLHIRPTEVQKRCVIFYEGEWKNAQTYNYCLIVVENSDEDLQVTYYITDDREMNWVTELMDSAFFTRAETEHLSSSSTRNVIRAAKKSAASGSTLAAGNRGMPR